MASVLAAVLDDLRAILDGSSSESPIASGRYQAVEYDPGGLMLMSSGRPYPFEVEVGSRSQPTDYPSDVSGDYAYFGRDLTIRVAYAGEPHEGQDQQNDIVTDDDEICLALEDPASWSASGFVAASPIGSEIVPVEIPGSEEGATEFLQILEIQLVVVYRESRP